VVGLSDKAKGAHPDRKALRWRCTIGGHQQVKTQQPPAAKMWEPVVLGPPLPLGFTASW